MEEIVRELKQAVEYTKNNEYKQAEKIYLTLNKQYPENESILSFTGLFYYNLRKFKKAEKYLDKAYKISESKTILRHVGLTKYHLSKYRAAIKYLELVFEDNKTIEILRPLVTSCIRAEEWAKVYQYGKIAHELSPFDERILAEFSLACIFSGHFQDAELYTRKLLSLNPKLSAPYYNLGLLQEILYSNEEKAREYYYKIVKLGDKATGYMNLAISYLKDDELKKEGFKCLKKVRKLNSTRNGLNFLFASYYLSQRKFTRGYKYYIIPDICSQDDVDWYNKFKHPWTGGTYKDEVLMVYGDQGLGDQIQFSRYIPFLLKRFKKLKILAATPLVELFKYSFRQYENIEFYPKERKTFPRYDKSVLLANSLYFLKKKYNDIPFASGYLEAEQHKIEEYKTKYFDNNKRKVAICWEAGATGLRDQIHRTLNVELFEKIIKMNNAKVYSFQVKPTLDNYKKYPELTDIGSTFKNFEDTAAALKNIDILITVDTSIAHLAGALGVKTYLILPYCSDWRWFDNTEKTEWYDSVKIFKQKHYESWDSVLERVYGEVNF